MKERLYLGIDTSNYTTSVAVADGSGAVRLNAKRLLPVPEGQQGLRQSDALFFHTKALPELLEQAREPLSEGILCGIGVSNKPREREGSYMPCFLAGVSAASAASVASSVPLDFFSHQCGHLAAAIYSSGDLRLTDGREFYAFHLSGGTTELLRVRFSENRFLSEIGAATADISAGQLIDRVGVALGFPFPCGASVEKAALCNRRKIPDIRIVCRDGKVNLSGFENKIKKEYAETGDAAFAADYALKTVLAAAKAMLFAEREKNGERDVLFSGGVMSCAFLKEELGKCCRGFFGAPVFSSDNAAGIAILTARKREAERRD